MRGVVEEMRLKRWVLSLAKSCGCISFQTQQCIFQFNSVATHVKLDQTPQVQVCGGPWEVVLISNANHTPGHLHFWRINYEFRDFCDPLGFPGLLEWLKKLRKLLYFQLQFIIKRSNQKNQTNEEMHEVSPGRKSGASISLLLESVNFWFS